MRSKSMKWEDVEVGVHFNWTVEIKYRKLCFIWEVIGPKDIYSPSKPWVFLFSLGAISGLKF